jgi:single-stranded-DNA-specific exonuclease
MASCKRWSVYPSHNDLSTKLGESLGINPVIAQVLLNRGIRSLSDAHSFLTPDLSYSDSFPQETLFACSTVLKAAMDSGRPVFVYGDYDVDGMTSTTLMVSVLRELGVKVAFYIPNRFKDGYGLTTSIKDTLISYNCGLLITLDCGTSNAAEIEELKRDTDLEVLIFDHHTLPEVLPVVEGMLNPRLLPSTHWSFGLCTVGIVYDFLDYFVRQYLKSDLCLETHLDLVALGTIADVAPMFRRNRALTAKGLEVLTSRKRVGINALLEIAEFKGDSVTSRDVGFTIAPRLNASGRIGDARVAVDLLLSQDQDAATALAHTLNKMNQDRQALSEAVMIDCLAQLKANPEWLDHKVLVLSGTNWHAGVVGIISSRLVERFHRPVILIAVDEKVSRGSCRSVGRVNMYDLLNRCLPYYLTFGGHKEAAGFSMAPETVEAFKVAVRAVADEMLTDQDLMPILELDSVLDIADMTLDLAGSISRLSPFGPTNPSPLFYAKNMRPISFKTVGANGTHLKVTFSDPAGKYVIDAIGFGLHEKLSLLYRSTVDIACSLEVNRWQGNVIPQLSLIDIREGEGSRG